MRYRRDVPRDDQEAISETILHVRAHMSSVASSDDDETTHADDVVVKVVDHEHRDDLVTVLGWLDAEPNAPYLDADYDPDVDAEAVPFAAKGPVDWTSELLT